MCIYNIHMYEHIYIYYIIIISLVLSLLKYIYIYIYIFILWYTFNILIYIYYNLSIYNTLMCSWIDGHLPTGQFSNFWSVIPSIPHQDIVGYVHHGVLIPWNIIFKNHQKSLKSKLDMCYPKNQISLSCLIPKKETSKLSLLPHLSGQNV